MELGEQPNAACFPELHWLCPVGIWHLNATCYCLKCRLLEVNSTCSTGICLFRLTVRWLTHSFPAWITVGSKHQFSPQSLSPQALWWWGFPWTKTLLAHTSFFHRLSITVLTGIDST